MLYNIEYSLQFEFANELIENNDRARIDTLGKITKELINYSDFDGQGNIYETLVNSGEINLMSNSEIVEGIRGLEERFLYVNRIENIHYETILNYIFPTIKTNIKISTGEVQNKHNLYTTEFQNLILLLLRIMGKKDEVYNSAIQEIEILINRIDLELHVK